jgi:excisionase family DNA binding protein
MAHRRTTQQFVTLREAARCLGIGVRAVYRARDRGELATYQFGTPWCWVRLSDARAWLECHRCPPARIGNSEDAPR